MPTPELVGVVAGCTAAGVLLLKVDGMVRQRLVVRRHPNPWPQREQASHHNVAVLPVKGHGELYDWAKDDPWSPRYKRG